MIPHARSLLCAVALLLLVTSPAAAWSNKEHMQFARLAAERLIADPATPPAMKQWLADGLGGKPWAMDAEKQYFMTARVGLIVKSADPITYWATMPDMMVMADQEYKKTEPYGVHERLLHYVDLEYFNKDAKRREYAHDLSAKPTVEDFPDDMKDPRWARAGMLPFRTRECYQKLVAAIRAGRLADQPGKYPRDEHAHKWAGYLAHYAADNTQPQHATADYKSSAYFFEKRKAPNVHSEMEYRMCDDDADDYADLRAEFWPLFEKALAEFKDPVENPDVFRATLEVSLASYDALPLIGQAAMAAAQQGGTPEKPQGPTNQPFDTRAFFRFKGKWRDREATVIEMKAIQTAWAVKRIERLWLQAWAEAQQPAK
ncbi:MAG TPA: hypothetical protein VF796_04190 [Humisphaera sp.]